MWSLGPLVAKYLSGTCASGLHEALLGREHFGGEVHTYSAAFTGKRPARDPEDLGSRGLQLSGPVETISFDLPFGKAITACG